MQSDDTPAIAALTAYLERVHLVSDPALWARQRAAVLMRLDGGTVDALAGWLAAQRIVFPGFEHEVARTLFALAAGQTEPAMVMQDCDEPHAAVQPVAEPSSARQRVRSAREATRTQQLALF